MINIVWVVMIVSGIVLAVVQDSPEIVTQATFQAAQAAVKYALMLAGVMSFWLGIMKIAEEAGLVRGLARLLRPFTSFLFPSIPSQHPAMGSILMNLSANILGMGNAATPFGLKAMGELQELNGNKEEASEAMCTFLAINTACLTLMPTMILGIRLSAESAAPAEIVGPTIFATAVGMGIAIVADGIFRKIYRRRL